MDTILTVEKRIKKLMAHGIKLLHLLLCVGFLIYELGLITWYK